MTIIFSITLTLNGFPDVDGERIIATAEADIHRQLTRFKSPIQARDSITVERKGVGRETRRGTDMDMENDYGPLREDVG